MKNLVLIIFIVISIPNIAFARKGGGLFGKNERVQKIIDLDGKGPNGEEVFLAHKTTSYYFLMGAYLSDDGYVLGIRGKFGSYYPLNEEQINQYQKSGFLPTPLPKYEIPLMDWVWGFALWIMLLVIAVIWFFPSKAKTIRKG